MTPVRLSLATKCQLLFGAAVVIILFTAMFVVSYRMSALVKEGQEETARKLANAWLSDMIQLGGNFSSPQASDVREWTGDDLIIALVERGDFDTAQGSNKFLAQALERFKTRPDVNEYGVMYTDERLQEFLVYARAIRKDDLSRLRGGAAAGFSPVVDSTALVNPLQMVLIIRLKSELTARQQMLNQIYLIAAGIVAGVLAIGVFYLISMRLILSPVRVLRDAAEKAATGNLNVRAEISTGDEFEQLSGIFNQTMETLKASQDRLKTVNKSLDLKLGELAQSNVALFEANKIKGEFLANVSHELRTPLNSIIGFAELLVESLGDSTNPQDEKKRKWAANITVSSRRLLELINDLLDLAKIEAGRVDLRVGPVSVADTVEGLVNLIRPQADKRGVKVQIAVESNLPVVLTDPGKLQQIMFNFLSNAVKFSPEGKGLVILSATLTPPPLGQTQPRVRIAVIDNGPGIKREDHERIFEKFTQVESTHTRGYEGTGLGLTICKELAELLQGQILLDSEPGRGATFMLYIPVSVQTQAVPLMPSAAQRSMSVVTSSGPASRA
jgi:two-component system, NarL family, sensor histidine kinase BarA